ncbi:MAG: hypothetical protein U9R15_13010 [Chloroflexota bacterium]|nr:hypothetical protein [Chloroflexota bacterium]
MLVGDDVGGTPGRGGVATVAGRPVVLGQQLPLVVQEVDEGGVVSLWVFVGAPVEGDGEGRAGLDGAGEIVSC